MGFGNVGKVWTPGTFADYLKTVKHGGRWDGVTLHHTASPSLTQRPEGLKLQHIINIRDFYKNEKGWSSGPHLFTDEDQIWGMCPLTEKGVHAVSFNSRYLGIEALGDYDLEDPMKGRGLLVWQTTAQSAAALFKWLEITPTRDTLKFHRDDSKTTKSCPGDKVSKGWVLEMVLSYMDSEPEAPRPTDWAVTINGTPITPVVERMGRTCLSAAKAFALMGRTDLSPVKTIGDHIATAKGHELEGAWYDREAGETFAPARELAEAAGWRCGVVGRSVTITQNN